MYQTSKLAQAFKITLSVMLFLGILFAVSGIDKAFAVNCDVNLLSDEPPPIDAIVCPAVRAFNALILLIGTGFIVVLIYHGIKLALALGDPKGFESARLGMVYACMGAFVVLCFWGIFSISANILGINQYSGPQSVFDAAMNSFTKILEVAGVEGGGTSSTGSGGNTPPAPTCVPGSNEHRNGLCSPPPQVNGTYCMNNAGCQQGYCDLVLRRCTPPPPPPPPPPGPPPGPPME